jgi:hypothetical protein
MFQCSKLLSKDASPTRFVWTLQQSQGIVISTREPGHLLLQCDNNGFVLIKHPNIASENRGFPPIMRMRYPYL